MDLNVAETLVTAVPFIVSWVLTGYLLGAYSMHITRDLVDTAKRTTLIWLLAGPVGIVLRAIILQIPVSLPFAGVTMGFMWIALLAWRVLFAFVHNQKRAQDNVDG